MNENNYLNLHVIISHSPSCLNRDDMNMQKSAMFGGVRRVRISSQSLKRAIRISNYFKGSLGEPSVRSRNLELLKQKFVDELKNEFDEAIIRETVDRFAQTKSAEHEDNSEEAEIIEVAESAADTVQASKKIAVAPWVIDEIRALCGILATVKNEGLSAEEVKAIKDKEDKKKGKKKKTEAELQEEALNKKLDKAIKEKGDAVRYAYANARDIALYGRMATSGLMTTIDGAVSVAHSITTHAVDADIDWFTAVDDLVPLGSGHLDTQEFSSGVFYRYASVNLKQLQVNLGLIPDMKTKETPEGRKKVLEISAHLLHLLATIVPSAKQRSFAAFNPADLVMASFSDIPISAANAFESPVEFEKTGGYLQPSIKAFDDYITRVYAGYGLDDNKAVFSLWNTTLEKKKSKLEDVKEWVRNNGMDKK
ncbi:MAG: type I-E CRISPR-associated protein Cas7/Cse4/CasC [Nitrospiraceae bacterium]|nr:MAG: type I-E CRISPR-associated protein Cas7/Cse4/CasC [Nitrospiraceae bacterium]